MAQLGSGPFFLRKARRVGEVFRVSSGATGKLCCCCLALSGSPVTLGRDILCQKSDKPGKPSHGAKCNTWNAPADIGNWTELFWGFGMTLDAACHEGSAQHCSEHVCFPAMTFPVLSFPSPGSWFGNAETKRRYIGVMMLTLTPRYLSWGQGPTDQSCWGRDVMGSSQLTEGAWFWEDCLHRLSESHSHISLCLFCG